MGYQSIYVLFYLVHSRGDILTKSLNIDRGTYVGMCKVEFLLSNGR